MKQASLAPRPGARPFAPRAIALVAVAALPLLLAAPASAHHLMDLTGMKPGVLTGLLSGLAHPILGPDHLLFLLAIGLVGIVHPFRWVLALLGCGLVGQTNDDALGAGASEVDKSLTARTSIGRMKGLPQDITSLGSTGPWLVPSSGPNAGRAGGARRPIVHM